MILFIHPTEENLPGGQQDQLHKLFQHDNGEGYQPNITFYLNLTHHDPVLNQT